MTLRVLVDCDVVLDLLLARRPHFEAATRLFMLFQNRHLEGFVSPLGYSNLFYVLRKATNASDAIEALTKLRQLVRTLSVDSSMTDRALTSSFSDFEDALHYYTAEAHGLDAVVTGNKRDYRLAKLPILNADECVRWSRSSQPRV